MVINTLCYIFVFLRIIIAIKTKYMKHYRLIKNYFVSLISLIIMLSAFALNAQQVTFNDTWKKQGLHIEKQDKQSLKLSFSVNSYERMALDVNGRQMEKINMQGSLLQNSEGNPDLPVISRYVAIPQGAEVKVSVNNKRTASLNNINISPAPRIPWDTDRGPLEYKKNNEIYSKDAFFPSQNVIVSEPTTIRGLDVVLISISPFQYNPVTKEMLISRDMDIEIEFVGGNGHFGEDKYRNRFWDPILFDMVINDDVIDKNYQKANRSTGDGYEYLIIAPNDPAFLAWADTIKVFRQRQGIITGVVTIDEVGGNTVNAIETYVNDAYNNWDIPPIAVLLMGDYGTSGNTIISPIYDNYCVSDNIFSDVNGDYMPEMTFARMTARNNDELETMVHKALNYERNPPTNPGFYANPITAMGWQTERWFQLCSEIIAGFFENELEKSPVRENAIYSGTPAGTWSTATNTSTVLNYFGPNGLGYIPASPDYLDDWGGNATRINNDINAGAFLLQHRDHGMETGWGEPSYTSANIAGLRNTDLSYIFSINCLTGKYNITGECFVETFHRHDYGALGLLGASEVSYSFVNDTYVWGAFDYMWPDFMPEEQSNPLSRGVLPAFSNVAGKYFLQQSNWPYNENNKAVTYNLFHTHGDAFTQLYYEVPQDLTVFYEPAILSGLNFFTITANAGSFICLTVDNEIIGTAEGTGMPLDVVITPQEPGTMVDIVITKQNYYRYESSVEVIPPDGPYCLYDMHQVNDSLGNDNNKVEFCEEILLDVQMKNLGNDNANNVVVSLSTTNPYCTILKDSQDYDTLYPGTNKMVYNAFKIKIADDIPDQTVLEFDITSVDENDSTWNSKLFLTANAPKITPVEMVIDDSETGNDDGILDPGENANIRIKTSNTGHCVLNDVSISLVPYNNFITVNSEDQIIPILGLLGGSWVEFNVDVSDEAPLAVIAEMHYTANGGAYEVPETYFPKIGQFLENWETGDFNKFEWQADGDMDWEISTSYPYQGYYHAVSGAIGDNQSSSFKITYEVMANDVIKFWRKVSCEEDFDKLNFYIDDNLIDSWSGSSAYTQVEYPVNPGIHTFKWEYAKDYSGLGGMDKAWIDNIELPTMLVTTLFAGPDSEVCATESYMCEASATNYSSINWTTSGDGIFENGNQLNAVYNPGENDLLNTEVTLTLNIIDNDDEAFSDDMLLTFNYGPEAPETPEGEDYVDVYKVTETSYTTNIIEETSDYEWELLPAEAGEIMWSLNEATVYWNPDFMGDATLKVRAINDCGGGDYSDELNIFVDNTVGINNNSEGFDVSISPNPNNGEFKLQINSVENQDFSFKIINYQGVEIMSLKDVSSQTEYSNNFDLSELPSGIYLVSIKSNDRIFSKKLLITK
ncbi:MAG: hypothetical protein C0598_02320 [Marinilabiliales bacterium]|nr:MAG: hypothetical protein C0598_02320 [Marinilabiliales bacterium]